MKPNKFQRLTLRNGDNVKINEYQTGAVSTAIYPTPLAYPTLGLCGEVGELLAAYEDGTDEEVEKEAGDVLWYLANVANDLGLTMSELLGRKTWPKDPIVYGCIPWGLDLTIMAGRIAEQVKKTIRDSGGVMPEKRIKVVKKAARHMVDLLANALNECESTLDKAAIANNAKLLSRQERGVLTGDGDNR